MKSNRKIGHPRVVVIGAGFGGLNAARILARSPVQLTLIDRNNYHTFMPLLYQVAAAEIEPEEIAYPVRSIFRGHARAGFVMGEVTRIDFDNRMVITDGLSVPYDYLIISIGSVIHYYGVAGAAEYAFPLKTLEQAVALRNHILSCFERAEHEPDPQVRQRLLTFAIIGGGPTGVEYAGALSELIRGPLKKDFPSLDSGEVRIVLLEAAERLLAMLPPKLSAYGLKRLARMGIDVRLRSLVENVTMDAIHLSGGGEIPTATVVWTAGVKGDSVAPAWGLPTAANGLVPVLPTLQHPRHPDVYVIGDMASFRGDRGPLPMLAPVAIQQGVAAARNILRQLKGRDPLPFKYKDKGTLATIGRNAAVAQLGRWNFTGYPAWILWVGIHLVELIGFRNRLLVMINWAWDYLFFERAVRLILPRATGPTSRMASGRSTAAGSVEEKTGRAR